MAVSSDCFCKNWAFNLSMETEDRVSIVTGVEQVGGAMKNEEEKRSKVLL